MEMLLRLYMFYVVFFVKNLCEAEVVSSDDAKVVCYFASWATYRPSNGKFDVEDIDSTLCTHAIYAFAGINNYTLKMEPLDEYNDLPDDYGLNAFGRFVDLKIDNPDLKVLLAVGGYNQASSIFSRMASKQSRRERFIDSALSLIQEYGFDGIDLDWEYPANRGGKPEDKENFVLLVQEMKKEFEEYSLMVTAAVGMGFDVIETAYDIKSLSDSLDSIHLMTYDYHGSWEWKTNSYSPLFSRPEYTGNDTLYNVNATVNMWLEGGADPKKLVLGVGAYGQTYLVQNCIGEIGELDFGDGKAGQYTNQSGMLGYNEICEEMKDDGSSVARDEYSVAPWTCLGSTWASFDDIVSAKTKSMWGKETGLGGGMIWSIDTDDFSNICSDGPYPILSAVNVVWKKDTITTKQTTQMTTTKPITTTVKTTKQTTKMTTPKTTNIKTTKKVPSTSSIEAVKTNTMKTTVKKSSKKTTQTTEIPPKNPTVISTMNTLEDELSTEISNTTIPDIMTTLGAPSLTCISISTTILSIGILLFQNVLNTF